MKMTIMRLISIISPDQEFPISHVNSLGKVISLLVVSKMKIIKFSEILRCETIQDNSTIMSDGIGRAIAGGILGGGVGAVVGANTRKSKDIVSDLRIKKSQQTI